MDGRGRSASRACARGARLYNIGSWGRIPGLSQGARRSLGRTRAGRAAPRIPIDGHAGRGLGKSIPPRTP
eukprot:13540594-Alexandrium_andersonii.AAC.1